MKIRGIECAFAFIYIVSILYFITKIPDKNRVIRCAVYLVSTVIVTVPFVVVSPITARCMFTNYMFWIILCGELFTYTIQEINFAHTDLFADLFLILPCVFCIIIGGIDITNNHYNTVRYNYIKEQIADGKQNIEILIFPYAEYVSMDQLFQSTLEIYDEYSLKYYGITELNDEKYTFSALSCNDYNTLMESE